MAKHTIQELYQWQALPLNIKVLMTTERIRNWVDEFGEDGVYLSFSAGKDSTVLGHIIREVCGYKNIPFAIQDKEDVKQITVVEKNREVIELVGKQLPLNQKVNIVNDDVFEYKPLLKYNAIYMDIWNYINEDVYNKQMKPLINCYRKYLVPITEDKNRYIDCWCKKQAKNGERI